MSTTVQHGFRALQKQLSGTGQTQAHSIFVRQVANLAATSPAMAPSMAVAAANSRPLWAAWLQDMQESCSALWQQSFDSLWLAVPKRKVLGHACSFQLVISKHLSINQMDWVHAQWYACRCHPTGGVLGIFTTSGRECRVLHPAGTSFWNFQLQVS